MDGQAALSGGIAAYEIRPAAEPRRALVVASPHSGAEYPEAFVAGSALDRRALRRSEDCFVDALFADAPAHGAPLLRALFPRAFVDPNREPYELDPAMFEDDLPAYVNRGSPRVAMGLGTIARVVADGQPIYRTKLRFAEAEARLEECYRPYHRALAGLVEETRARFGHCVLIDAHSMPSGILGTGARGTPDFVLGDRLGRSCHPALTLAVERALRGQGYSVVLNSPYAGGYTTVCYGSPAHGRHCLQIEVNRGLYMDEAAFEPSAGFESIRATIARLIEMLGTLAGSLLSDEKKRAAPIGAARV